MVSAPVLLAVLVVGLVVSIFQAATQINEATLTFVPKIVAAVAVLAIAGPWMMTTLVEYLQRTLQSIPGGRLTLAAAGPGARDRCIDLHRSQVLGLAHAAAVAVPARAGAVLGAAGAGRSAGCRCACASRLRS